MNPIPYGRQLIDDDDIAAVVAALRSDYLTTGPAVAAFEEKLCGVTGAKHAVACANGTAALHLACMALEIGADDLGVTSPLTFLASANCVEFCGGRTDFVDIDETLCLSPAGLEEYCRTVAVPKVVIPVDFAGVPANLPAIRQLADTYGFKVIEDAAHAIGSSYTCDGTRFQCASCAHSDLAILSFHPVKTVTTGEGGAVTTNDDRLAQRIRLLRTHGMTKDRETLTRTDGPWYYEMHELGYNYRITDFQCALGTSQLARLDRFRARRQEIVGAYNMAFADVPGLVLPPWPEYTDPCFHLYPVRFAQGARARAEAFEKLKEAGILCQIHYYPVHLQPYYRNKYGYLPGKCELAERFYDACLSLPLYPGMSDGDVEMVVAAVAEAVG